MRLASSTNKYDLLSRDDSRPVFPSSPFPVPVPPREETVTRAATCVKFEGADETGEAARFLPGPKRLESETTERTAESGLTSAREAGAVTARVLASIASDASMIGRRGGTVVADDVLKRLEPSLLKNRVVVSKNADRMLAGRAASGIFRVFKDGQRHDLPAVGSHPIRTGSRVETL